MNDLVFFIDNALIAGLIIGAIYALGAIGVTLVFGILRFAHFAHGDMMTMGAFISLIVAWLLQASGFHSPLALVFIGMFPAMVLTALIAIGLDKLFYKPLRDAGARPVVLVMASVGVTLMLQGVIRLFGGVQSRNMFIGRSKDDLLLPPAGRASADRADGAADHPVRLHGRSPSSGCTIS